MMSFFTYNVIPDQGEPFTVQCGMRDSLKFERTGDRTLRDMVTEPRMEDHFRLAFLAAQRIGKIRGDLNTFEETHEIELVVEAEESPDFMNPSAQSPSPTS